MVRVPGGVRIDGIGLKIWGAPEFREGDRALLFLNAGADGVYRPLHLMLGAFHLRPMAGRTIAFRDLSEAAAVGPEGLEKRADLLRDFEGFAEWLSYRALGVERPQDYLLSPGLGQATEKFTQMRWPESRGGDDQPIRWFRFDTGQGVEWRVHSSGQPGLGLDQTIDAFTVAIQSWVDDPGTNIRYSYVGTTESQEGLVNNDGISAIIFNDPYKGDRENEVEGTFRCPGGGVIAVGGPYFFEETRTYRGERYHEAVEADIVTNDGTECFFRNNPRVAEEVFAHELGHTLGIGHSEQFEALMFAIAHNDSRGARLHGDDRDALAHIYGGAVATRPPAGPKKLAAKVLSSSEIRLTWRDMANNEESYRIEMKQGNRFVEIEILDLDTTEFVVAGLQPNKLYVFRLRAHNSAGFSPYSNQSRGKTFKRGAR
jgi:hypothetical protein